MAKCNFACVLWLFLGTAVSTKLNSLEDCSFTLKNTSGTVHFTWKEDMPPNGVECIWKINSPLYQKIAFKLFRIFGKEKCDCSCGSISFSGTDGNPIKKFCFQDLPSTFQTVRQISVIHLKIASVKYMKHGPLFVYHIQVKDSLLKQALEYIRVKRDSDKQKLKAMEQKDASIEEPNAGRSGNDTVSSDGERSRFTRLPVILPAVLTVVIFIACLTLIALKMYNADDFPYDGSVVDLHEKEITSCWPKRNRKKRGQNELYDVMLKEYKAETHRKNPLRKSSTIRIEGYAGNDPQTIAKKHLLLNKIRNPSTGGGAVGTLIKLSSTAFIASSMVRKDSQSSHEPIIEEDSAPLLHNQEQTSREQNPESKKNINGKVPEAHSSTSQSIDDQQEIPKIELDNDQAHKVESSNDKMVDETGSNVGLLSPDSPVTPVAKEKRYSGSIWFKYKRLEKQPFVTSDSDEEIDYDCAQHIHRILSASKENIDEARRILPDDVKDIVLPQDLETALAEFELWPDSTV